MTTYNLKVCHLYGNLLNTYGDNGNLLILDYYAKQLGINFDVEIVSIYEDFNEDNYDFIFFGGGQDFEQVIVSKDIQSKKQALTNYIENDGVMLAICGGFQLLGEYYIGANGEKIHGIHALPHYTLSQENNRFIGDIEIYNKEFDETYYGFENHNGMTFLGEDEEPLGVVRKGHGNNDKDDSEGVIYKNVIGSYFHGPLLARNKNLALRILNLAMKKKYNKEFTLQDLTD
ncbi:type 1 glutamine amidotransferase [Vagococcus fluvialis]|jgi:CobQ-like glutamine amidotransferase family enzyme|uniref:Lipid II isoglutaminyl synthase (glutamine-hydrolyzing) subunit GatD n=1 Tax=Vagococcus fluvialis TaxID=2738 RepID=A0A7X6I414_9ENTE|nr:adenosylcobyric acid synthase [Vagococcus fluvialis]MDR2278431.1 adenosylcobyric acid synthase [Vagococcus sp.]NKC69021.1 adenosylcobyric acid synthase [Vagococcus fluvialis]